MRNTALALVVAAGLLGALPGFAQLPVPTPSLPPLPVATPTPVATPPPPPVPITVPTPPPVGGSSGSGTPTTRPRQPRRGSPGHTTSPLTTTTTTLLYPVSISGNTATFNVALGGYSIDVAVVFETVANLTADSLGISARIATPDELATRLPAGTTAALPLVFAIEPPAAGGLDFHGVAYVDIHTHDLNYTADSPLRLYSAPLGGAFADITETTGTGSYRASGSKGGFSEFLIVADTRALDAVIQQKYDTLQALLGTYSASIPDAVEATLQQQLDASRDAWHGGDYRTAAEDIEAFAATVKSYSGAGGIPDEWRSARDLVNVAGYLRAAAGTLRYSLVLGE